MRAVMERLMARVVTTATGCWEWTGPTTGNGYGVIGLGGRGVPSRVVHRVTYEAMIGSIPTGLDLDHLCRNRACVNPVHLEPVTRLENVRRGRWGPGVPRVSHCRHGHEYTPENTKPLPDGRRRCRICFRAAMRPHYRARYLRRKAAKHG